VIAANPGDVNASYVCFERWRRERKIKDLTAVLSVYMVSSRKLSKVSTLDEVILLRYLEHVMQYLQD